MLKTITFLAEDLVEITITNINIDGFQTELIVFLSIFFFTRFNKRLSMNSFHKSKLSKNMMDCIIQQIMW